MARPADRCQHSASVRQPVITAIQLDGAQVRVVALLAIGHRKGDDKGFAGRFTIQHTVFAERWGEPIF